MLSFDSMKLESSFSKCFNDFSINHQRIEKHTLQKEGIDTLKYRVNCKDITGLKNIEYLPEKDSIIIELSGKILGKDYPLLINQNTIIQALEGINQNECLTINPDQVLENAVIHSIDCTKDIHLEQYTTRDVLDVLNVMTNRSYKLVEYPTEGVFITKIARSNNKLLKFYDKDLEMMLSRNDDIRKQVKPDSFHNAIRSELCLRKHDFIRKDFNINHKGSVYLKEALLSRMNPNHKFWIDFLNPVPYLFEEYDQSYSLEEIIRIEGIKGIIHQLRNDQKLILNFIMKYRKEKNEAYRVLKKTFRPIIEQEQNKIHPKYTEIQEFISQSLLVN